MPQSPASTNAANGTASAPRTGGFLRTLDQLDDLQPGEFVECHACHEVYDRADLRTLDITEREHIKCPCGKSGFILRGTNRHHSIAGRRPMLSGTFYPSASELRDYGNRLGLDGIDRLTIEAIDSFPDGWDMTYEDIAAKAGVKVGRVKATLKKLREYDGGALIESEWRYFKRSRRGVIYDLTPLWNALAATVAEDTDARETSDSVVTTGEIDPKTTGEIDPYRPLDVLAFRDLSSNEGERMRSQERNAHVSSHSSKPNFNNGSREGEASTHSAVETFEDVVAEARDRRRRAAA